MNPRPPKERGLFWVAVLCLAIAGGAFVIVYGACNRFTAGRSDVGTLFFGWERHIPLVRELVVPYWTLDLFFCGSFFLCRSRGELRLLTSRLVLAVLACGACFLLFPLRYGWARPEPEGWTSFLFRALYANDMPFNLAPSLHIALRSLVWITYGRHLRGRTRTAVKIWFIAIGVSTLLVWQHHLLDVATGFAMGWAIQAVRPDGPRLSAPATAAHRRLAARACVASLAFAALAIPGDAWLWWGWPAVATGIMALAYARRDGRLIGKENGTLSPAAEWCLLPWLIAARIVQHRWLRRRPAAHEIAPGILFGRRHTRAEASALVRAGPLAVLDLTAESTAPKAFRERAVYRNLPLLDLVPVPSVALYEAMAFIRANRSAATVLIQCQLGLQRSATIAAAWLLESGAAADERAAGAAIQRIEPLARLGAPNVPTGG